MCTIVLFSKIQVDTAISHFLLNMFGERVFPGIAQASVEFWTQMPNVSVEELEKKGYILIDLGMSKFDHHRLGPDNLKYSSAHLVAEHLGVSNRADVQKLLELARRDDLEGRGTISQDPIDRAFGLSALLTNLNKSIPDKPQVILNLVNTILTAHFLEENRRHEIMPREFQELKKSNKVKEFEVKHYGKTIKVIVVESDNPALAGYIRSAAVGAGLVIQKSSTGHVNFVANQRANVRLNTLASLIKTAEAKKNGLDISQISTKDLQKPGRTEGIPHWYYDTRANTLQNGGINPQSIPPTSLLLEEIIDLCKKCLTVSGMLNKTNSGNLKVTKGKGVVYLD